MADKFQKPDAASLQRMTPMSVNALLETLRVQRAQKVAVIDQEIEYYEGLLKEMHADRMQRPVKPDA